MVLTGDVIFSVNFENWNSKNGTDVTGSEHYRTIGVCL